jgi:hypothetical protein
METMTMVEPAAPAQALAVEPRWHPLARIGFRFCFVYFSLYCVLTQIINSVLQIPKVDVPDWAALPPLRPAVFWVAAHVFGLKTPLVYSGSGSGDKQFDWVLLFCMLVTAAVSTAVWSWLDRKRANYAVLHKWFWLFLRFCLAGQMFVYGMVKAVPLQMPYPFLSRLVERFGDFSPMGVLWSSVGAAPGYETFTGCAEILAGLLLIFPRTMTLGALICLADMTQVFLLNMTYDVPVKLLSFHLILISLLLLSPDMTRLANLFLLNRAAEPATRKPLFEGRRAQRIASGVIAFLWLWMLGCGAYGIWDAWHQYGGGASKSPLYGIWNIQSFTLDGTPQPLAVTDAQAWRRMIFDFPQYVQIEKMDDLRGYALNLDAKGGTLTLTDGRDKNWQAKFAFVRPAFDKLTLDGTVGGKKAVLQLARMDENEFVLKSRGFHWVQDYPFNR